MTMLRLSLILLGIAMLFGFVLAALNLRGSDKAPPLLVRVAHGVLGAAGLGALLLTMGTPVQGASAGVGPFRMDAVVLLGAALLLGLGILATFRIAPKSAGAVIALHATIALFGLAILAAYVSLG
jgi:hypothetical protein